MASPLAGVAAINAVGFGVYGNLLKRAEDPTSIHSVTMAGTAAGCVQVSSYHHSIKEVSPMTL